MAQDPVCGMMVDVASVLHAEHDGHTYYFCSDHCLKTFQSNSAGTDGNENAASTKDDSEKLGAAIYTCPMHPEVQQDHPGDCPKCGMALEPKTATVGTGDAENDELRDMTTRFWLGAALTLPVFLLAMVHMVPVLGRAQALHRRTWRGYARNSQLEVGAAP